MKFDTVKSQDAIAFTLLRRTIMIVFALQILLGPFLVMIYWGRGSSIAESAQSLFGRAASWMSLAVGLVVLFSSLRRSWKIVGAGSYVIYTVAVGIGVWPINPPVCLLYMAYSALGVIMMFVCREVRE